MLAFVLHSLIFADICRYREEEDRFRVPLFLPIIMCLFYVYLIIVPIIAKPSWYYLGGLVFGFGGLLFYIPFVLFKEKFILFDKVTIFFQILFQIGLADKDL